MTAPQQLLIGGVSPPVSIAPHTLTGQDFQATNPSSASATFQLNSSGAAQAVMAGNSCNPVAGTTNYTGEWLLWGSSSSFECRATLVSGTLSSGTTGTWLALSTTRSWNVTSSVGAGGGNAGKNCTILVEIRDAATLIVLDSDNIALISDANSG